jgi:hypothetical protein
VNFNHSSEIEKLEFKNKFFKKINVFLKRFEQAGTDETIEQAIKLGLMFVPSPYLFGLGVKHPNLIKQCRLISSIDDTNLFPQNGGSFLSLRHVAGKNEVILIDRYGTWGKSWVFGVVPIGTVFS